MVRPLEATALVREHQALLTGHWKYRKCLCTTDTEPHRLRHGQVAADAEHGTRSWERKLHAEEGPAGLSPLLFFSDWENKAIILSPPWKFRVQGRGLESKGLQRAGEGLPKPLSQRAGCLATMSGLDRAWPPSSGLLGVPP